MVLMVDSYRFLDGMVKRTMRNWASMRPDGPTPWTPLTKPLAECTVAFVSSAALALSSDRPFDDRIERNDPWFSDPSYRVIPRDTRTGGVQVCHLHIKPDFPQADLNCVLPLERLAALAAAGEVGGVAPSHYSYIGYTLRPERLLRESVPAIVECMRQEHVDAVVLVPV